MERLKTLATQYHEARALYQSLSTANRPEGIDAQIEADMQFRLAKKAVVAARLAYEAELDYVASEQAAE